MKRAFPFLLAACVLLAQPPWTRAADAVRPVPHPDRIDPPRFLFATEEASRTEGRRLDDLLVSVVTPPPNDDCENALVLTGGVPYAVDTAGANTDNRVPACEVNFGKGVWFTYTPAANGMVEVSTCGSGFDTVLQVYAGLACRLVTEVDGGCNDDNGPACAGTQASVRFNGTANTTYQILAGGFDGQGGSLSIVAGLISADLVTTKLAASDPVPLGRDLDYTVTVANLGPHDATGVTVIDRLPVRVTFGSATASQGVCTQEWVTDAGEPYVRVTCSLGTLAAGASATVTITVTPAAAGVLTNAALAFGLEADPNTVNNVALATVRVADNSPPVIRCPSELVAAADPGQCAKSNVTFDVTATDNDTLTQLVCTPPSGSTFPVGVTTVNCTATDTSGNTSSCRFTVTIRDLEPPAITCPANIVADADPGQCSRGNVTYAVTATDNCPGVTVVCVPPSGSAFPVGVTTVNCTATDAAGNVNQCSFTVTVRSPPVITAPPQSRTNNVGGAVTFTVAACGSPPLAYQWLFNGEVLPGETSASYTIAPVQPSHAGEYRVVVKNSSGETTSDTARLTLQLINKTDRWASDAIQTALATAVYANLTAELETQGYRAHPWNAQVQWGFDYRSKDPRPVCQAVMIPCQPPDGSDRVAIIGLLLGIGPSEDRQVLGPHPIFGGVVLMADARGEQRTVLRVLYDRKGASWPLESLDDACLAGWFHPANSPPEAPAYPAMIADLVQSSLDCAGGHAPSRACSRAVRSMGLFTYCVLAICLPPGFQEAIGASPGPQSSAANVSRGTIQIAGAGPLIDGTQTCCGWDPAESGLIGGILGGATGGFDLGGGLVGAILGGLKALFELNDDEAEWCIAHSDQYAVLEGTVGRVFGPVWNGTAGGLPTHFSSEDSPFTHDSLDWIIDVAPFSSNDAWAGSPDYAWVASQFNKTDGGQRMIECEWESRFVPDFIRTWPGDRIWVRGQLIFDCGHPAGIGGAWGYRSEIHPPHAVVTMRLEGAVLFAAGPALPARVARAYITPWAGEANHPDDINGDGRVWSSGATGTPRFDATHTPYQIKIPLPPKPRGADLTPGAAPSVLVRVEPAAEFAVPSTSVGDGGGLRVTRQQASHAYLQKVLGEVVVSLGPDAAHPDHVLVRIPLTDGPIPDLGGGISPVQLRIAVGWNDAPLALQVSATMPVLDAAGVFEITPGESPVIISPIHPLANGRGWVPPDRRTRLRVTGPDSAWQVTPLRVDFTRVHVAANRDDASPGEYHLKAGVNGEWRGLPIPSQVDDGKDVLMNVPVTVGVWHPDNPRLEIAALGFEEDQMNWGLDQDDQLGAIFARHTGSLGVDQTPFLAVLSTQGDYSLDYRVVGNETACGTDALDPANDQPAGATAITAPGTRSFAGLRVGPRDTADWFTLDTDDYMTLIATLADQTAQADDRCRTYNLQVITERAVLPPDPFDDGLIVNTPCAGGGALMIQEFAGRNENWAASPILRLCPSPFGAADYDCEVHPLLNNINPDGLAIQNLNFHLPYAGVDVTPDRDFFRIQIPTGLDEQCGAPCPKELQGQFYPTALRILIEADRDRPVLVTITNFASGFVLDNDPATPAPDTWTADGHTMTISRAGPTTAILLECPRRSGLFPDGLVGLALSDPEGRRNFYDLFASYNVWAFCDVEQLLANPGLKELILGKLWGNRDPVPIRFLPTIGYSDPGGAAFARAQSMPFVDLPAASGALPAEDRWLVLLPRGNATMDIVVQPPPGADGFDVGVELLNLLDQRLAVAQEIGGGAPTALSAPTLGPVRAASLEIAPRHYRLDAGHLDGCFYLLKVTRPRTGGTFTVNTAITRSPDVAVSPAALSFGNRVLGRTGAPQWITVRNGGNASLTVSNLTLTGMRPGDFSLSDAPGLPAILTPGSDFTIGVRYQPGLLVTSLAEVVIESDDPDENPVRVSLSGTGQAQDREPPRLSCPAEMVVWTCGSGAVVEYRVGVDDDGGESVNLVSSPPSGSFFPLGTNVVNCTATDAAGRSSQCQFIVLVLRDAEPPQITAPVSRIANLMNTNGAVVFFNVDALDNANGTVPVTCTPPSGSWFPLGQTAVTCRAEDACGNRTERSFPVIVQESVPVALRVVRQGSRIVISWPAAAGYELETSTALQPPVHWLPSGAAPIVTPDGYMVSIEAGDTARFYKLTRRP